MAYFAILHPEPRVTARLAVVLEPRHLLVPLENWPDLLDSLENVEFDGCIIDGEYPDRETAGDRIAELRDRFPRLTVIVSASSPTTASLFELGGLGVHGVMLHSASPHAARADIERALSDGRGRRVRTLLGAAVPEPGPEALAWAVAHAEDDPTPEQLAAAIGRSPRELRDALEAAGLPTPRGLLLWGRLLLAAARLADDGRTVESVSFSLGYAAASSLARAMKVSTGLTPTQVVEGGGMEAVLDALLDADAPRDPFDGGGAAGGFRKLASLVGAILLAGCACTGGGVDHESDGEVPDTPVAVTMIGPERGPGPT